MAEVIVTPAPGKLVALDVAAGAVAATTPSLFANDGQTLFLVIVGATPTNLTVVGATCSHGRGLSTVLALSANKTYIVGPFPKEEYNDANGKLNMTFSSVATVTVMALRHP